MAETDQRSVEDEGRPLSRYAALAALAGAVLLVFLLFFAGGGYEVRAVFHNAGQLVKGNEVLIGGRPAGLVRDIQLTADGQAVVRLSIDDGFAPLRDGTDAIIRQTSLSGVANRYVSINPGPDNAPKIADGGLIETDRTTTAVDLDQLFDTFDEDTVKGLRGLVRGAARQWQFRGRQANRGYRYLAPALSSTQRFMEELGGDQELLTRFIVDSSKAVSALAERRDDVAGFVRNGNATARAIASESESLADALEQLPPTFRLANTTFVNLRATLDDLDELVEVSRPAARRLRPLLEELQPLVENAVPTLRSLRRLIRKRGPSNDLLEQTRQFPQLQRIASQAFSESERSLRESRPTLAFQRPYVTELTGWFKDFSHTAVNYDANGHYARLSNLFVAFSVAPNGELVPLPPEARGPAFQQATKTHRKRCPGANERAAADKANPFRGDEGDLDCDPTQVPPGS